MEAVFARDPDNGSDSRRGMPRLKGALGKGEDPGLFLGSVPAWKLVPLLFLNPICLFPVSRRMNKWPYIACRIIPSLPHLTPEFGHKAAPGCPSLL